MNISRDDIKQYWDKRAKSFPRYSDVDNYQSKILDLAKKLGVDFKNKVVLDVGAGTGVYTIRIAREAEKVIALDISPVMLGHIVEDANIYGLKNISTVEADWLDYKTETKLDIIFCSLTPAICSYDSVDKIALNKGCKVVSVEFFTPIRVCMIDDLYEAFNLKHSNNNKSKIMRSWLEARGVTFLSERVQGEWRRVMVYDEAFHNCTDILDAHSNTPDIDIINKIIENYKVDENKYESKTTYDIEVIVWDVM